MEPNDFDTHAEAPEVVEDNPCIPNTLFLNDIDVLICDNDCEKRLKVPTKQCLAGHLFCTDCHGGHVYCMKCVGANPLVPALRIDRILSALLDSCPYKFLGCDAAFPFYGLDPHLKGCQYAKLLCPIPNCLGASVSRNALANHLVNNHGNHVSYFEFGVPMQFALQMHTETRVLIGNKARYAIIISYDVGAIATKLKIFSVPFYENPTLNYIILDQFGGVLIRESPIPTTTLKEGDFATPSEGTLTHQLRSGEHNLLNCCIVINQV